MYLIEINDPFYFRKHREKSHGEKQFSYLPISHYFMRGVLQLAFLLSYIISVMKMLIISCRQIKTKISLKIFVKNANHVCFLVL